jgi:hypothetical protein
MQNAAFYVGVERHAQARRQHFDEQAVFGHDLGGTYETAGAIGPEIFPIPGDTACVRAHQHAGGDMVLGSWGHGGTKPGAQPGEHPAKGVRPYHLIRARVIRYRGGLREALAYGFGQTAPGSRAQHFAQAVPHAVASALSRQWPRQCGDLCHVRPIRR